jgi:acyl carrier protein
VADAQTVVMETIRSMLDRRDAHDIAIHLTSDLFNDLEFDSLEVAELSAVLEETMGTDPYSAGEVPRTVGSVIGFYSAPC